MKRFLVVLLMFCIAVTVFAAGGAQRAGSDASTYPNRPIEILAGTNPGTGTDLTLRLIAPYMEKYLGVPIVITNDGSVGGEITLAKFATSIRPDGYTWNYMNIVSVMTKIAANPALKVDPLADYCYVGTTYVDPAVIVSKKDGPYKTLDDLIRLAKANPGTISFGCEGLNSVETMVINDLQALAGIKLNIVEAMGGNKGRTAVMGGHMDLVGDNPSGSMQAYLDGAVEFLAVGGDTRWPEAPDVPTFKELGYGDIKVQFSERAFFGPAEVPQEIQVIFADAIAKAAADPEYLARAAEMGLIPTYKGAEETTRDAVRFVEAAASL